MEIVFVNDPNAYPPGSVGAELVSLQEEVDMIRAESAIADMVCKFNEFVEEFKKRLIEVIKKIADVLTPYLKEICKWCIKFRRKYMRAAASAAGKKRIAHLALYSRRYRTRKKNYHRIMRILKKWD